MNDITVNEIKEAACGYDSEGKPKAIVVAGIQKFDVGDTESDPVSLMEVSTLEAIVDIKSIGDFCYVNLKFPGADNADLKLFYRCLERYYDEADKVDEEHEIVSFFSVIPLELAGRYTINAIYPVFWALEPDLVGDPARTLRAVFIPQDVQFIRTDLNDEELGQMIALAEEGDELSTLQPAADTEETEIPDNPFAYSSDTEDDEQ